MNARLYGFEFTSTARLCPVCAYAEGARTAGTRVASPPPATDPTDSPQPGRRRPWLHPRQFARPSRLFLRDRLAVDNQFERISRLRLRGRGRDGRRDRLHEGLGHRFLGLPDRRHRLPSQPPPPARQRVWVDPNLRRTVAVGTALRRCCRLGPPPAQNPASGTTALGSHLGSWRGSARRAMDAGSSPVEATDSRAWSFASSSAGAAGCAGAGVSPTCG
jgi:hypothetical protein